MMVADRRRLKQKWPDRRDLESWWIWHMIQISPMHDLDDPEVIHKWLVEFQCLTLHGVHKELYGKYNDFRLEFVNPLYAGYAGSHAVE